MSSSTDMKSHLKNGYEVVPIIPDKGGSYGASIPLVLPNDHEYDLETKSIVKKSNVQRSSLYVVPEAMELLSAIDLPVAVLAISGPMRTGKSYILSRLLGEVDAFDLGHTFDPKTFGIWMGTSIIKGKDKNGNEQAILLLDTEGIDAPGANASQDAGIFVLTILVSSILIYNSTNVPFKKDLEKLDCFVRLAESFKVKKNHKMKIGEISQYFPHFIWLLRDVSLITRKEEGGTEMDPTDYIKQEVLTRGDGFMSTQSDEVGRAIVTFFPDIECKTLPTPHGDSEVMQNITKHTHNLNIKFREGIQKFMEHLIMKVHANGPKRGYQKGSVITGSLLCGLLKEYVEAVNDPNAIPCLDNAWQNTVDLLRTKTMDELVKKYKKTMKEKFNAASTRQGKIFPLEENQGENSSGRRITLMGLHDEILKGLTKELLKKVAHFGAPDTAKGLKKNSEELVEAFQKQIIEVRPKKSFTIDHKGQRVETTEHEGTEVCGGVLFEFIRTNRALSVDFCTNLYNELFSPIKFKIENETEKYSFNQLEQDFITLNQEYIKHAIGPEKWNVLSEMDKKTVEAQKSNFKKVKGYQEKVMKERQKAKELENEARQKHEELTKLYHESLREKEKNAENLTNIQANFQEQIRKLKEEEEVRRQVELRKLNDLQKTNFAEFQHMITTFNRSQNKNMKTMIEDLKSEKDESRKQIDDLQETIEKMQAPPVRQRKPCNIL